MIKIERPKTKSFKTESDYLKKLKRSLSNAKYYQKTHKPTAKTKASIKELKTEIKAVEKKLTPKITKEVVRSLERQGVLTTKTSAKALKLKGKERVKYIEARYKKLTKAVYKEQLKEAMITASALGTPFKKPSKAKSLAEISYGVLKGSGSSSYVKGAKAIKLQTARYTRALTGDFKKTTYINNLINTAKQQGVNTTSTDFKDFIKETKSLSPRELSIAIKNGLIPHLNDIYLNNEFVEGGITGKSLKEQVDYFKSQKEIIKNEAKKYDF